MRKSGVFSMVSDNLNFREVACGFPSENLTPTSESVASSESHQHLGFKQGMAIASLNINGLRSHLDEVQLLMRDLGILILALKAHGHVTVNKPVISMIYIVSHTWPLCSAQILVDGVNPR